MSIHCSNCGCENDDGSRFCEACGSALTQSQAFESQPLASNQDSSNDFNWLLAGETPSDNSIKTKLPAEKLNKANKEVFGVAIAFIVISIIRTIFSVFSAGTVQTFEEYLPWYQQNYPEIARLMQSIVNTMYVEYFIFAAALATSIALMVFAAKMKHNKFPVQTTEVFDLSKKAFVASAIAFVLMVVFLIVEIVGVVNIVELDEYFEEDMYSPISSISGFIMECCWIMCTAGSAFYALRIAKSKE